MSLTALLLIAAAVWFAYKIAQGYRRGASDGRMLCPHCGTLDNPICETRGSFAVELLLWLCFIVPGLIYSAWRLSNRYYACRACGHEGLLPLDSPRAQAELRRLSMRN